MKRIFIFLTLTISTSVSLACPQISGKWACYEKNFDAHYQENFQISEQNGISTYLQTLTDESGEQPTYDKITDNVVRVVNHLLIDDHDYYFKQNSFCPDTNTLQTHEEVERHVQNQIVAKSKAEFIIRLDADGSLSMITNSTTEDGAVYENDFIGRCTRL